MLEVDETLPEAALAIDILPLTDTVARLGGHWWSSEPALITCTGGAITTARPRAGDIALRPARDNAGAARLRTSQGTEVIAGTPGEHAGLVTEARIDASQLGLIVVFSATEPGRQTLVAAQSDGAESTAVLSVMGGALVLKDRKAEAGLSRRITGHGPATAFVQLGMGEMALSLDGRTFDTAALGDAFAPGATELLLGCVRERAGLTATLGPHRIADVIALPDIDLRIEECAPLLAAFRAYTAGIFADAV